MRTDWSPPLRLLRMVRLCCLDMTMYFQTPCFMWLLYDYRAEIFSTKQAQIFFGFCFDCWTSRRNLFSRKSYGYITNERFQAIFNVDPQLWSFDLGSYIQSITTSIHESGNLKKHIGTSPNPFRDETVFAFERRCTFRFPVYSDEYGRKISSKRLLAVKNKNQKKNLASGMYLYKIIQPDGNFFQGKLNVE